MPLAARPAVLAFRAQFQITFIAIGRGNRIRSGDFILIAKTAAADKSIRKHPVRLQGSRPDDNGAPVLDNVFQRAARQLCGINPGNGLSPGTGRNEQGRDHKNSGKYSA